MRKWWINKSQTETFSHPVNNQFSFSSIPINFIFNVLSEDREARECGWTHNMISQLEMESDLTHCNWANKTICALISFVDYCSWFHEPACSRNSCYFHKSSRYNLLWTLFLMYTPSMNKLLEWMPIYAGKPQTIMSVPALNEIYKERK